MKKDGSLKAISEATDMLRQAAQHERTQPIDNRRKAACPEQGPKIQVAICTVSLLVVAFMSAIMCGCSIGLDPVSSGGGGSEAEARAVAVAGEVYYEDGTKASGAAVYLKNATCKLLDTNLVLPVATTDDSGYFRIDSLLSGRYMIEIRDSLSNATLIAFDAGSADYLIALPPDTLRPTGAIAGIIGPSMNDGGTAVAIVLKYAGFLMTSVTADSAGAYLFERLASGRYELSFEPVSELFASLSIYDIAVSAGETNDLGSRTLFRQVSLRDNASYIRDSSAVRALLDRNGISIPVAAVSKVSESARISDLLLDSMSISVIGSEIGLLDGLVTLDLRRNALTELPSEIGQLARLQNCLLDGNELMTLPDAICSLQSLVTLRAAFNRLSSLPDSIGKLCLLEELFLDGNQLIVLPVSLENLVSLKTLRLSGNQLTSLPGRIGLLRALATLTADNNCLKSVPATIGDLRALAGISLHNNQLAALPESFGMLQTLDIAWLDNNRLTALPASIGSLKSLRYLSLSHNQLTSLPASVASLTMLRQLRVNDNALTSVPGDLRNSGGPDIIDVAKNRLCTVPDSMQQWLSLRDPDWRLSQSCDDVVVQAIRLRSPLGGEVYRVGEMVAIRWEADPEQLVAVLIGFSPDNGRTWYEVPSGGAITASDPLWGNFVWQIPDTLHDSRSGLSIPVFSDSCRIRVSDYFGSLSGPDRATYYEDVSPNTFSVKSRSADPPITVIAPDGTENYVVGDTLKIDWAIDKQRIVAVKIYLSTDAGKSWILLTGVGLTVNDSGWERFLWPIPQQIDDGSVMVSVVSQSCLVKVEDYFGSDADISDRIFTIGP